MTLPRSSLSAHGVVVRAHSPLLRQKSAAPDEKSLLQHSLLQIQPQVACSAAPGAHRRTLPVLGTAVASLRLVLWQTQCLRNAIFRFVRMW